MTEIQPGTYRYLPICPVHNKIGCCATDTNDDRVTIRPTTRWAGTYHQTEYGCPYCGLAWQQPEGIRDHMLVQHPKLAFTIELPPTNERRFF